MELGARHRAQDLGRRSYRPLASFGEEIKQIARNPSLGNQLIKNIYVRKGVSLR
jgi:hypothetical protein